jgi:hypothetical protein
MLCHIILVHMNILILTTGPNLFQRKYSQIIADFFKNIL